MALSGGADSVALLLILKKLGYRIEAVHCNFRLRGEESDLDEAFVRQLCQTQGIPLHLVHFDTREYAALHKMSIEMAARELRYKYFEQLRQDIGAESICVAHHRDDTVETVLMNLMRGTGIHGLTGIRPLNGYVVRPLLCISRQEIEDFLQEEGQDFVTDSSNLISDVLRNKIRLDLIPLMRQIIPSSSENISRTADHLLETEKVFNHLMESEISAFVKPMESVFPLWEDLGEVYVSETDLSGMPSAESFLFEWLTPYGFKPSQILQIASHQSMPPGNIFQSATHQLVTDRGRLILAPIKEKLPSIKIPEDGTYVLAEGVKLCVRFMVGAGISKSRYCVTLDKAKADFPLTVRLVQEGDRFCPFGMKGSKLVSDYLTDCKVSLLEKRRQLVVTDSQGDIIWLVGHRTDDRFKVSENTTAILQIEIKKNPRP